MVRMAHNHDIEQRGLSFEESSHRPRSSSTSTSDRPLVDFIGRFEAFERYRRDVEAFGYEF